MAFSTKMVPSETDISSFSALIAGPTAAMADPPQIAVPTVISVVIRFGVASSFPNTNPNAKRTEYHRQNEHYPAAAGLVALPPRSMPNAKQNDRCLQEDMLSVSLQLAEKGFPVSASTSRQTHRQRQNQGEPHGERIKIRRSKTKAFCHILDYLALP